MMLMVLIMPIAYAVFTGHIFMIRFIGTAGIMILSTIPHGITHPGH